jgi:hypothetical protein
MKAINELKCKAVGPGTDRRRSREKKELLRLRSELSHVKRELKYLQGATEQFVRGLL